MHEMAHERRSNSYRENAHQAFKQHKLWPGFNICQHCSSHQMQANPKPCMVGWVKTAQHSEDLTHRYNIHKTGLSPWRRTKKSSRLKQASSNGGWSLYHLGDLTNRIWTNLPWPNLIMVTLFWFLESAHGTTSQCIKSHCLCCRLKTNIWLKAVKLKWKERLLIGIISNRTMLRKYFYTQAQLSNSKIRASIMDIVNYHSCKIKHKVQSTKYKYSEDFLQKKWNYW